MRFFFLESLRLIKSAAHSRATLDLGLQCGVLLHTVIREPVFTLLFVHAPRLFPQFPSSKVKGQCALKVPGVAAWN